MRKKHDEGYALVFVLVVMVVLSLIAISLMTAALKNLQNQQATVAQMEAKYEAQGEMEKIIGEIQHTFKTDGVRNNELSNVQKDVEETLNNISNNTASDTKLTLIDWVTNDDYSFAIDLQVKHDTVQIDCSFILKDVIGRDGDFEYSKQPEIQFESYTVSYLNPSETQEGGGA